MKILKVRKSSINYNSTGTKNLKEVMARRCIKNNYTHIQVDGVVYNIRKVSDMVWVGDALNS